MKRQRVRRLALSYLVVIMVLSLVFSVIIYTITSAQLGRPLPPGEHSQQPPTRLEDQFNRRLERRDDETRRLVIVSLVVLNGVMLLAGYWLSLRLAQRTLAPIERSLEQQAQFVSDASHELRTPLAALLLSNEVALRKPVLDDEKSRQVLGQNVEEIKKLTKLSNSLLDLAKAEHAMADPESIDPSELADEIVAQFSSVARARGVKLSYDKPPSAHSMSLRVDAVRQILEILVDNAIKYASPEDGKVELRVSPKQHSVELTVKDNGPGIASSDQHRIFERFYRADEARTRTNVSGHGLGLAIAKSLADRCGYAIRVKSRPLAGAEFTLAVPCKESMTV